MRIPIPDLTVGLPILVIWIGVVVLLVGLFLLFKWWRTWHPRPKPRDVLLQQGTGGAHEWP